MIGEKIKDIDIIRQIGEGGMASIYEGVNSFGTRYAVKVLNPSLAQKETLRKRFKREAEIMRDLNHPNIVNVHDYADLGDVLAIVMEFLEGEDLQTKINRGEQFSKAELKRIFRCSLRALQYTHDKEIWHRDIKPSNIFITDQGEVKILDFGIAKLVQSDLDLSTTMQFFTPRYMSPEQTMATEQVSEQSDIYSFGLTMWTLINGGSPYDHLSGSPNDLATLIRTIQEDSLPTLRIHTEYNEVLKKALSKQPSDRFASCREFEQALDRKNQDSKPILLYVIIALLSLIVVGLVIVILLFSSDSKQNEPEPPEDITEIEIPGDSTDKGQNEDTTGIVGPIIDEDSIEVPVKAPAVDTIHDSPDEPDSEKKSPTVNKQDDQLDQQLDDCALKSMWDRADELIYVLKELYKKCKSQPTKEKYEQLARTTCLELLGGCTSFSESEKTKACNKMYALKDILNNTSFALSEKQRTKIKESCM